MSFLKSFDNLTLVLLSSIILLIAVFVIFYSLKKYEMAIALILLSPWAFWLLTSNIRESDIESMSPGIGTYMRILVVALVGIIGVFQFFKLKLSSHYGISPYLLVFGFFVFYALFSTIYSIDKKYTFVRSSEFLLFFSFLAGFYYWLRDRTNLDKTLNIYFIIMTCGAFANIIALALFPGRSWSLTMTGRFQGLLDHPNTLGAFCMLFYPILLWKYQRVSSLGKMFLLFLFFMVLFMHVLSGSRASLVTSILGFSLWFIFVNRTSLKSAAKILSLFLIVLFGLFFLLQSRPASLKRETNDVTDLTGRYEFWQGCVQLIGEKPVVGYGYGVGGKIWSDPRFYKANQFLWSGSARASLHNGYLSITIGLGLVGLLIWLSLVLLPAWRIVHMHPCSYKALIMVILFQGMILNFVETSIVSGSQIITSLVFWLFLIMAQRLPFCTSLSKTKDLPAINVVSTR